MDNNKKKSIVFTVTNDLNHDRRMHRIANAMHDNGYEVTLIGFLKQHSVDLIDQKFSQIRLKIKNLKGKLFYLEYNYKLYHFLKNKDYDIFCAIDLDTLLPVYKAAKNNNKPLVLDSHELYLGLPEIQNRFLVKMVWTALEKYLYPKLKYAYTVNESIAKFYKKKYNVDFKVIQNVPELSYYEKSPNEENVILYQGALNVGRGLEELIEAMKDVNAKLHIAGTGEIDDSLKELVTKLNLNDKVSFLGYLLPDELAEATKKATVGINLINGSSLNYYYSLANKFFDYMHALIPQVTMNFPEYKNINDKFNIAVLVDDLKTGSIADGINKLLKDKESYNIMVANCLKAKDHYNWEKESVKLIDFYSEIANK